MSTSAHPDAVEASPIALVTGATGYVGGLLAPRLLDLGWRVRVITRDRSHLDVPWADQVEIIEGDLDSDENLRQALTGVDVAYYLVHSMDGSGDFAERDAALANSFGQAAAAAEVRRIVFLSGLHPASTADRDLSPHLASRVQVGQILMESGVPTAVLQAAVILGDGSASFDMLRHLTTRLPAMITPKWLDNRIQPIAIDDVLHYLAAAADLSPEQNRTFDIGGPEVLTYKEMIRRFASVAGLHRRAVVTVPLLTPTLASYWVGLVTPIDSGVAKPLVGSLVHEVICGEHDLDHLVGGPPGGPIGFDEAVRRALRDATPDSFSHRLGPVAVAAVAALGSLGIGWALRRRVRHRGRAAHSIFEN